MPGNQRTFREVSWNDVKADVKKIAPDIFEAIEILNPDSSYRLYEATYAFGDLIVNDGFFHLPDENEKLNQLNHPHIKNKTQEDLNYNLNAMPLALILQGEIQLFTEEQRNLIESYYYYKTGEILSSRPILDQPTVFYPRQHWKISSGARQSIMLASTANATDYKRLKKKYDLKLKQPDNFELQWNFLKELANSPNFKTPWQTRLLVFSKKWIEKKPDLSYTKFRLALMERSWKLSAYERNMRAVNVLWNTFTSTLRNKYITAYTLNMARHIIECALSQNLSHSLYKFDDIPGPFNEITKIILEDYQLPKYAPIIFVPRYFDGTEEHYISIKMPTTGLTRLRTLKTDSVMNDERTIKYIIDEFKKNILDKKIKVAGTPFEALKNIEFEFFNTDLDKLNELKIFENVIQPEYIKKYFKSYPDNQHIWSHNEFIRACVKISKKNSWLTLPHPC